MINVSRKTSQHKWHLSQVLKGEIIGIFLSVILISLLMSHPTFKSFDKSSYFPNISWIQPFLITFISISWTRLKVISLQNYYGSLWTALCFFICLLKFILKSANRIILFKNISQFMSYLSLESFCGFLSHSGVKANSLQRPYDMALLLPLTSCLSTTLVLTALALTGFHGISQNLQAYSQCKVVVSPSLCLGCFSPR